jgi:transposase
MLPSGLRVFVSVAPVSMSKSIDGLGSMVKESLNRDPATDGVFVFINSKRDRVKLLWKDATGWCVLYKRFDAKLVVRAFVDDKAQVPIVAIDAKALSSLLEGVAKSQRHKRREISKKSRTEALSHLRLLPTLPV